jgi:SAM-dependent methyltransferase
VLYNVAMDSHTYPEMYREEEKHFWFVGKRLFIAEALDKINTAKRNIVDIGAGTGGTTKLLTAYGNVLGIEKNKTARTYAKKRGLRVINGSANKLPIKTMSKDMVTFFDVLYHKGVNEPKALKEALRILKKGGILLITDCAIPWLSGPHDIVMDAKYRYTKSTLSQKVTQAGFVIDKSYYIFVSLLPLFAFSRALSLVWPNTPIHTPHWLINNLCILVLKLESKLPLWIPRPLGSSILILAHKP